MLFTAEASLTGASAFCGDRQLPKGLALNKLFVPLMVHSLGGVRAASSSARMAASTSDHISFAWATEATAVAWLGHADDQQIEAGPATEYDGHDLRGDDERQQVKACP